MKAFCQTIVASLEQGVPLALCSIASGSGSAPRTSGARMIVYPDGQILGTVGGGRYEAEIIAAARELLYHSQSGATIQGQGGQGGQGSPAHILHFSLKGADDLDMICGGELNILVETVTPGGDTRAMFSLAAQAEAQGKNFCFVSRLNFADNMLEEAFRAPGRVQIVGSVQRNLFLPSMNLLAGPSKDGLRNSIPPESCFGRSAVILQSPAGLLLVEPFPAVERVHIFGAGHVSRALAQNLELAGFKSIVIDDRAEFATRERFPHSGLYILPGLGEAEADGYFAARLIDAADAVVIVTRGHAHDRDVLAAALKTNAGYTGMIGSRGKVRQVFDSLLAAGFKQDKLDKVHSPIGLKIGAETPEEIAVSITAELILWRSGTAQRHGRR